MLDLWHGGSLRRRALNFTTPTHQRRRVLHSELSWHVGEAWYAFQSDGYKDSIPERTNSRRHGAAIGVPKGQTDGVQA